jgi:DNA-binding transcriptional ArsR family regulator
MAVDVFAVLADPTRRRVLAELRDEERTVGDLVGRLEVGQPTMSKHLKVLREAGFVSCRAVAQQRIYRLEARQFTALEEWLAPYRRLWGVHLAALERHLDVQGER